MPKVGKYDIALQVRDNPKTDSSFDEYKLWSSDIKKAIYVHRKPVAQFEPYLTGLSGSNYNMSILDTSYDLDHTSRTDKGIKAKTWKFKDIAAEAWSNGIPSTIPSGKTYLIQQVVQDIEGEWSMPLVKPITAVGANFTPTVDANPASAEWTKNNITVTVTADDKGENDFNRTVYASNASVLMPGSFPGVSNQKSFTLTYSTEGIWYLHMRVYDNAGNNSYRYRGPYKIDKTPPEITPDKWTYESMNKPITVNVNVSDILSGVSQVKYCWSKLAAKPSSGWQNAGTWSFSTSQSQAGSWYLHIEAWDNAGNSRYVRTGGYVINNIELYDFTVTMIKDIDWRDFYFKGKDLDSDGRVDSYEARSGTDIKTSKMPINFKLNSASPLSYKEEGIKAGSKVMFYIKSSGDPEVVVMKPSYMTEKGGSKIFVEEVPPVQVSGNVWQFEWVIPMEAKQNSFIWFDVTALKDGVSYGNQYWIDVWQSGNNSRSVFYVEGNVLNDLKFNQSH